MLMPNELNRYADQLLGLINGLEGFILADISRRIANAYRSTADPSLPATAVLQMQILQDIGTSLQDIRSHVAAVQNVGMEKFSEMFEAANLYSVSREQTSFQIGTTSLTMSAAKHQIISASIRNFETSFLNLTGSIGLAGQPLEQAYLNALNTAYMQVSLGARDYTSAIRAQVKELADKGVQAITYSRRTDQIDVAVRRAVLTALKDTTNLISEINADEMGADGWQISAHAGARPTHAIWQGRIFARYTTAATHPLYDEVVGDGMEEPNCRHTKWGVFLGLTEPYYTEEQLAKLDWEFTFSVDGRTYNSYEASQRQRAMEVTVRQTRREIVAFEAAGLDDAAFAARQSERVQVSLYNQFSREANLPPQRDRMGIYTPEWQRSQR